MLSLIIFIVTLIFVIWQPRGFGIGWSALIGAGVALATGVVGWSDVNIVWDIVWDATFTFVALIIISLILDEAGFFAWAALHVARWGKGNGRKLFPLIILLGAAISAVFANDGAALLLTPIVLAILLRLKFSAASAMAFTIACGFIADTASLPFIVSNLVNIVTANYFSISFGRYASVMFPVNLVSISATLLVLILWFKRDISTTYSLKTLDAPHNAIRDIAVFRTAFPLLILLLAAYFITGPLGVPISLVTGSAALILMAVAGRWATGGRGAKIALRKILHEAPWQIVLFSLGMYLVVFGLGNAWLTDTATTVLVWLSAQGTLAATIGTGFVVALLASIMNNMPATLVGALAVGNADVPELTKELMIYANVVGNDLGPKITPIGSLATLLWLHVLAGKGQRITWGQYMKVGLVLTPPVLLVTLLALWLWLPLITS